MYLKAILAVATVLSLSSLATAQTQKTTLSKKKARTPAAVTETSGTNTAVLAPVEKTPSTNAAMTEYAYQPQEGRVALTATPKISNQSTSVRYRGADRDSQDDFRTNLVVLRAQRGLSNNLSLSAEVGVGNREATYAGEETSQSKGLTDFTFGVQQVREISMGQLFYGAEASLSPAEQEISYAYKSGRSADGNLFSGGHSLTPYVGVQVDRRDVLVGGVARLHLMFDRTATTRVGTSKATIERDGAHVAELEAFVEKPTPRLTLGAKGGLSVVTSSDTDARVSDGFRVGLSTNSYQVLGAGVYAKFSPSPAKNLDILPSLSLTKTMGGSGGSLSVQEAQEVSVAVAIRATL